MEDVVQVNQLLDYDINSRYTFLILNIENQLIQSCDLV